MSEADNISFRMVFDIMGIHVHCTFFVVHGSNAAHCGTLVVGRGPEFAALVGELRTADVISRDPDVGIAEAMLEARKP